MRATALALAALFAGAAPGDAAASSPTTGPDDGDARPLRVAVLAEGAASGVNALGRQLVLGGRITARLRSLSLALSVDLPPRASSADPALGTIVLFGGGFARDLSERLGWRGELLVGSERVDLRDYVHGGDRSVPEAAAGARAGLEWRMEDRRPRREGQLGAAPVVGLSATVLYVGTGSDRLRAAEWGGVTVLVTVTVGVEVSNRRPVEPAAADGR